MTNVSKLADRYLDLRISTDSIGSLWKGDLDFLEDWEDVTLEGKATKVAAFRRIAEASREYHPASIEEEVTLATIAQSAASYLEELTFREEVTWVNPHVGLHAMVVSFLPHYVLSTREHGAKYLKKLENLAVLVDQTDVQVNNAYAQGRLANRSILEQTVANIDRHLALPIEVDPLNAQAPPTEMTEAGSARWRQQLEDSILGVVRPAFARHRDLLASLIPEARPDSQPGLCYLDGGSGLYERLIWAHTTLHLTPNRIHEIGLEQIARLEDEYRETAGPLVEASDPAEIFRRLRDNRDLHYRDRDSIVSDAVTALARAADRASSWFGAMPTADCVVRPTDSGPLAYYSQPDRQTGKPGTFFVNVANPEAWGKYQLETVTFHESIPGHHLQIALALENPALHPVQSEISIGAFAEGWALYAERIADEMGLFSSEMNRVGMLADDSLRACRLVVDTGIHSLGWSRDQGIEFFIEHSPLTLPQVRSEVDRYLGIPGQALSYMIGRLEIERLRSDSQRSLGSRFNVRDFHDSVLSSGSVPLPALRRAVEQRLGLTHP